MGVGMGAERRSRRRGRSHAQRQVDFPEHRNATGKLPIWPWLLRGVPSPVLIECATRAKRTAGTVLLPADLKAESAL